MKPKVVTIGVHGATEAGFFHALANAQVDTFCDLRRRRGMRGALYAFANSARLQQRLSQMAIRYRHVKELAPGPATRALQDADDEQTGATKRSRKHLGVKYIEAFTAECLAKFNAAHFIEELGSDTKVIALFCVEREPAACHRSLVARHLHEELGLVTEDLLP